MRLPQHGDVLWTDSADYKQNPLYLEASPAFQKCADDFHDKGFTIVEESVPLSLVDQVMDDYSKWVEDNRERYEANRKPDGKPPRLVDYHSIEDDVAKLFYQNKSLEMQDFLFGGYETSIYTSLFFETSTQQPVHRDAPVFRTSPENFYFGMWVALEDATEENGALWVCPGGHHVMVDQFAIVETVYEDVYEAPEQNEVAWNAYQKEVLNECLKNGAEPVQMGLKKGQTLVWHPLLPHGGGKIKIPGATRFSTVFHTVPYGMAVYRQNVFFNREANQVARQSRFKYSVMANGRKFADFGGLKLQNQ